MDISQLIEANQIFAVLNLKLYEFKYGKTTEGMQRLKLYHGIVGTIEDLSKNKIVDLDSVQSTLSLVFPVMSMEYLSILAESVDRLKKKQTIDLFAYTETLFYMSFLMVQVTKQLMKLVPLFAMRSSRRSRLDKLESKPQVWACFKKIKMLEEENSSRGRNSAFSLVYQKELRPILQDTVYFKPRIEQDANGEEIIEKTHLTNDRVYKSIKKLYDTWKRNNADRTKKLIDLFDRNLWHVANTPAEAFSQMPSHRDLEQMKKLLADIDDMLLSEK